MANLTAAENKLLAACKKELTTIITEWSAEPEVDSIDSTDIAPEVMDDHAKSIRASFDVPIHLKNRRMVDDAIAEMWGRLFENKYEFEDSTHFSVFLHQLRRGELIERKAYHYAVDAYFRIYRGRKRGRPTLGSILLNRTAELSIMGATNDQIAVESGLDPKKISTSMVRKRIAKALSQERKK